MKATIHVPGINDEKALEQISDDMELTLEQTVGKAELRAHFHNGISGWGRKRAINLEIHVPASLHLAIRDGTGSAEVENVRGDLSIIDGTGPLVVNEVGGNVRIKDGTGSITVSGVGGDISVKDGTGGIKISNVAGSVTVNDGTGHINVTDVEKNLIIVNSGAGRLHYANIGGSVGSRRHVTRTPTDPQ